MDGQSENNRLSTSFQAWLQMNYTNLLFNIIGTSGWVALHNQEGHQF
jgi:hypothetical protein